MSGNIISTSPVINNVKAATTNSKNVSSLDTELFLILIVMDYLQIILFKNSYKSFLELLNKNGVPYSERKTPQGVVMASGLSVEILSSVAGASPWGALAIAIIAWVNAKSKRSVVITKKDNEVIMDTTVHNGSRGQPT